MNPDEQPVSKKLLDEAVNAILLGVGNMLKDMSTKLDARFDKLEAKIDHKDAGINKAVVQFAEIGAQITSKLEAMATDIKVVKRQASTVQRNTPTRKEFEELKSRVYGRSPLI